MSFNETEIVRDKGGKFAEKTGTAPEASIGETIAVPTCDRCGGPWGGDETCEQCCDDNGDPRPVPLELSKPADYSPFDEVRDEDLAEAYERAKVQEFNNIYPSATSRDDPRILAKLDANSDSIRRHAQLIARLNGPRRAFEAGEPHFLDSYLDDIWEGKTGGYSKEKLEADLADTRKLRDGLLGGSVKPRQVIGTGYKGNTRKLAQTWLDNHERGIELALQTKGRANSVNVGNARSYMRRDALPRA